MELRIIPVVSEKSYAQAQTGTYTFKVPITANKQQVAGAVAAQFGVKVVSVTSAVTKGKTKRTYRKSGSSVKGNRADVKKAYVRLAEGQSIPVFEGAEADTAKANKSEKAEEK